MVDHVVQPVPHFRVLFLVSPDVAIQPVLDRVAVALCAAAEGAQKLRNWESHRAKKKLL
jgi:hypothetical protein